MASPSLDVEWDIRQAAFAAIAERVRRLGPVLPWEAIAPPFAFGGSSLLLTNRPRGIFRPKEMRGGALSIKTTVPRRGRQARYEDKNLESDDAFIYRFQGEEPNGFDNELLWVAWRAQMHLHLRATRLSDLVVARAEGEAKLLVDSLKQRPVSDLSCEDLERTMGFAALFGDPKAPRTGLKRFVRFLRDTDRIDPDRAEDLLERLSL